MTLHEQYQKFVASEAFSDMVKDINISAETENAFRRMAENYDYFAEMMSVFEVVLLSNPKMCEVHTKVLMEGVLLRALAEKIVKSAESKMKSDLMNAKNIAEC